MALVPLLSYTAESQNGTNYTGTLTEATVYGSPEADRADVGVYVTGNKIKADGTVDFAVTMGSITPASDTSFTFDITKDGHYQFTYVIANDWTAGTYNANDLVMYTDGNFYQTPSSTSAEPAASPWVLVSDPTTLIGATNEPDNIVYQIKSEVVYPFSKKAFGSAAEDAAVEGCADCERGEDVKTYEYLAVLVDGMNTANQRQKYALGERVARKAQEIASV